MVRRRSRSGPRQKPSNARPLRPCSADRNCSDKTVVCIGGSAGIDLETARRARAEGADILTGRNPDGLALAAPEVVG